MGVALASFSPPSSPPSPSSVPRGEVCKRAVEEEEMQCLVEAAFTLRHGFEPPEYDEEYVCPLTVEGEVLTDYTSELEESKSFPGLSTVCLRGGPGGMLTHASSAPGRGRTPPSRVAAPLVATIRSGSVGCRLGFGRSFENPSLAFRYQLGTHESDGHVSRLGSTAVRAKTDASWLKKEGIGDAAA